MRRRTQTGRGNRTQYPWECRFLYVFLWLGAEISQDMERERARETLGNILCWRQKGNIRQENQSNDTATWIGWHDLLEDWSNEIVRMWPDSLLSLMSQRCPHLHRKRKWTTCTGFTLLQTHTNTQKPSAWTNKELIKEIRSQHPHLSLQSLCWCARLVKRIQARLYPPAGPKVG